MTRAGWKSNWRRAEFRRWISVFGRPCGVPEDPDVNVIRLLRNGVEVIDTVFPTENPLASGSSVRVITKENLEVILVPGKEKKALPKKRSWSDFILR